ncbi:MAG: hypothetical protein GAK43_00482 [Stenotrophomonas maltophilia]|nr:MAG: hypothetical protein GAK43_00482 [Stenotrophomonas maltophilia]
MGDLAVYGPIPTFIQQPQAPAVVHLHGLDQDLRRAGVVLPDLPLAIAAAAADVAARITDPQPALAVHQQRADAVVAQAGPRAAVEHGEIQPVVAHQAFPRGEPQMAFGGLGDIAQRVVRQAVARGPHVDGIVAQRRWPVLRRQRAGQQQQHAQQCQPQPLQPAARHRRAASPPHTGPAGMFPRGRHHSVRGDRPGLPWRAAEEKNRWLAGRKHRPGTPTETGWLIGLTLEGSANDRQIRAAACVRLGSGRG